MRSRRCRSEDAALAARPSRAGALRPARAGGSGPPSPMGRPRFAPEMSGYRRQWVMAISLTLLLGEPPRPGTLLAEVSEELAAHGAEVTVRLLRDQPLDAEELVGQSLVVHRGLCPSGSRLLTAAEELGIELCNPHSADSLLRDRRSRSEARRGGEGRRAVGAGGA